MNFNFIRGLNTKPKNPVIATTKEFIYTTGGTLVTINLQSFQQKIMPIHDKTITAFDFNNVTGQIATGQEGTDDYKEKKAFIAIIDISQMKLVKYLMDFNFGIEDLKFSNCGKFLAVHGWDFQLIVYKTNDYQRLLTLQQERIYPEIVWNYQNSIEQRTCFYLIESKKIRQFVMNQREDSFKENMQILQNKEFRNYNSPIFDNTNKCLITGTAQGEIVIFMQNNINKTLFKKVSQSPVLSLTKINNKFFCVTQNLQLIEFDIQPNGFVNVLQVTQTQQQPIEIFNSDSKLYYLNKQGAVNEIDIINKSEQIILQQPCNDLIDCSYDKDQKIILQFLQKGKLNLYNNNGQILNSFQNTNLSNQLAQKMYYNQEDNLLTLAYQNGDIYIYDINKFMQKGFISKAHKGLIQNIYRNNKFLLTCCDQCLLRIWSTKNYKLIHEFNYHSKAITYCSAFGAESELIISASKDRQIIIFDLKRERKVKTFQIQNGYVQDIIILDGNTFITIGHNIPLSLWNINSSNPVNTIEEESKCFKIKICQQKKKLALLTESGEIKIYDTKTLKKLDEIRVSYCKVQDIYWVDQNEIIFIEQSGAFGKVKLN